MAKQSLADWIHEVLADPDKPGRCTALALVHMTGMVENEVHVKKLPEKVGAEMVDDWADLFERKARSYAEGIPGAQTFCLQAFHDNSQRPTAKKAFVEMGYMESEGLMTEAPSTKGFMQQMMRHNEALVRSSINQTQVLFEALNRTLDQKSRAEESLRRENVETFGFVKELILQLSERKHEQTMAQIAAKQSADLKAEIAKQIPRLINTVTGRELIPEPLADSQLVEDFIDSLAEQGESALPALAQLKLPPTLLAQFAQRFQKGIQARQREASVRKTVDDGDDGIDGGLQ